MVRAIASALLLLAAIAGWAAPAAADPAALAAAYARINQIRAAHGLAPVTPDRRLVAAALRHARDMAGHGFMSHVGSDGSRSGQRADEAGYGWRLIAENVAAGPADAREVIAMWMRSPGHRHNLLTREVVDVGLAHVARGPSAPPGSYANYWVLVLAAPLAELRHPGTAGRP